MASIFEFLEKLPSNHRRLLRWFSDNAGADVSWPAPIPDVGFLATKAKGIYKPNGLEYALSVREMLGGPYQDREPIYRPDGSWTYAYHQEINDPARRDESYANRGLMACLRDRVPVGVMRQIKQQPRVIYRVLGLAVVSDWRDGYFILDGFPKDTPTDLTRLPDATHQRAAAEAIFTKNGPFNLANIKDERERIVTLAVARRGQPAFRNILMQAYGSQCAVTGCIEPAALEAAHISPYRGTDSNHVTNGILLRADIHTLFDLGLVAIDEHTLEIKVSPLVKEESYRQLVGQQLRVPENPHARPDKTALQQHRIWSGL